MSKKNKLVDRFLLIPSDFTWDELISVLSFYSIKMLSNGKTAGSSRKFGNAEGDILVLHEPHPKNIVNKGTLKKVYKWLKEKGKFKDE